MSDPAVIEQRIRAEYPDPPGFPDSVGKDSGFISGNEYEARLAQYVAWALEAESVQTTETEQRTVRDQVRGALLQIAARRQKLAVTATDLANFANLPAWGSATAAQRQEILRISTDEALQDIAGTIRVLIARGLIERNGQ